MNERIGGWIQTRTGVAFYPNDPRPSEVNIEDIAHALSNICRFAGHVKRFYCPTPEQRVLTADLRWVAAGDLCVGDRLLGFDEHAWEAGSAGKAKRRYRPSVVTHTQPVQRKTVRLELEDGSSIRASEEHPWLVATKASRNQSWRTAGQLREDLRAGKRRYMHKFIEPWSARSDFDAGWMAGFLDGEGYISAVGRSGVQGGFGQKQGVVLDNALRILREAGFTEVSLYENLVSQVWQAQFRGGWRELSTVLGVFRPLRLLENFSRFLEEGRLAKQMHSQGTPLRIVKAWDEGDAWVAGLETSTHTYICEGYGAHNSVAEHSYWVSTIVPPQFALAGLMHDAPEAYVVDLPKPLKDMLPSYKAVEHLVWDAICDHFGMPLELPEPVHQADVEMLLAEKDQLLGPAPQDWSPFFQCFKPANVGELPCWSPREAKRMFLERFVTLTQGGAA